MNTILTKKERSTEMKEQEKGFKFVHSKDFYYCILNGSVNSRLSNNSHPENELKEAIEKFEAKKREEMELYGHKEITA